MMDAPSQQEQASRMREFLLSVEWGIFRKHLDTMLQEVTNRTVSGSKEDFDYNKGVLVGLREARRLPEAIVQHMKTHREVG